MFTKWEIDYMRAQWEGSLKRAFDEGWEPFAVSDKDMVWLRRKVKAEGK